MALKVKLLSGHYTHIELDENDTYKEIIDKINKKCNYTIDNIPDKYKNISPQDIDNILELKSDYELEIEDLKNRELWNVNSFTKCDNINRPYIAISGKICSGKSTLAKKYQNMGYTLISFSDPMKMLFGKVKNRENMINFAKYVKSNNYYAFVENIEKRIQYLIEDNKKIVIDDLRFLNELNMLKKYNFYCIRLEVPENIRVERFLKLYDKKDIKHLDDESECSLDFHLEKFDKTLI